MSDTPTIAALSTPSGAAALSVLRISGSLARQIAKEAFQKENVVPRRANFGVYESVSGKIFDECVWTFFSGPASYTGEDMLEISCHGNPFIVRRILEDLIRRGCNPAQPGEFTRRAFLNGKMDLVQAEAVAEIISARSERAFEASRRLLSGELGKRISDWSDEILKLMAETEMQIDFSEEEVPAVNFEDFRRRIETLCLELRKTEKSARYFSRVSEGVNVVIFGAPNAGKSSLLNAILGVERSIVSDEAGTTRDFVSENVSLGAHCIRIVDTAGIREDTDSFVEKTGVERTFECMKNADFLIFVIDSSDSVPALPEKFGKILTPDKTLIVFNKSDLKPAFDVSSCFKGFESVLISLRERKVSEFLKGELVKFIESKNIVPMEDVLIVSERHAAALRKAEKLLREAGEIVGKVPIEFVSAVFRDALESLSEILGKFDNEKVLDKIFSSFCIGK